MSDDPTSMGGFFQGKSVQLGGSTTIGAKKLDVNFDADDFFNQMMEDPKPKEMPKVEKKVVEPEKPSFGLVNA